MSVMEELKTFFTELSEKYPEEKNKMLLARMMVASASEYAENCDYEDLIWELQEFGGKLDDIEEAISPEDRLKLISLREEFNDEVIRRLRTKCGCR